MYNVIDLVKEYKSQLTHIKDLKQRNKAFHALAIEDKRREMALDALTLLQSGNLVADIGFYWDSELYDLLTDDSESTQQNFCGLNYTQCEVCAKGALMVSRIRLGNQISEIHGYDRGHIASGNVPEFDNYFSKTVWSDIENVFEGWVKMNVDLSKDETFVIFRHAENRLVNILCNIIVNGNFDIHDKRIFLVIE